MVSNKTLMLFKMSFKTHKQYNNISMMMTQKIMVTMLLQWEINMDNTEEFQDLQDNNTNLIHMVNNNQDNQDNHNTNNKIRMVNLE